MTSAARAWRFYPEPVDEVINPLGCGDAMAAAIAWATSNGRDLLAAVRLGMAAARANLRQIRPGRLDPSGIAEAAERVRVEEA